MKMVELDSDAVEEVMRKMAPPYKGPAELVSVQWATVEPDSDAVEEL